MSVANLVLNLDMATVSKGLLKAEEAFTVFGIRAKQAVGGMKKGLDESEGIAALNDHVEAAAQTFAKLGEVASQSLDKVALAAEGVWAALTGGASVAVGKVLDVLGSVYDYTLGPFKTAFTAVSASVKGMFTGAWESIGTKFQDVFGAMRVFALNVFEGVKSRIYETFTGVLDSVKALMPGWGADIRTGLSMGFKTLAEDEAAFTRMSSILAATGGVAGRTAEELTKHADAMSKATLYGGDMINNAQAALLQFSNIRGDVFDRTTDAAGDLATVMGGDMVGAADKLGRALNDPVLGMKMLRSEGVIFTESERAMAAQMVATGKVAEVQNAILDRVASTVGGSAVAATKTFAGQIHLVNEAIDDQWKAIANALTPAITAVLPWIKAGAERTEKMAIAFRKVVIAAVDFVNQSKPLLESWANKAASVFSRVADWALTKMTEAFTYVQTAVMDLPSFFEGMRRQALVTWEELRQNVVETWERAVVTVKNIWGASNEWLQTTWQSVVNKLAMMFVELPESVGKAAVNIKERVQLNWAELTVGVKSLIDEMVAYVKNAWQGMVDFMGQALSGFATRMAKVVVSLPFADKLLGVSKEELQKSIADMLGETKKLDAAKSKPFKAPEMSKEDKARLEELRKVTTEDLKESLKELQAAQERVQKFEPFVVEGASEEDKQKLADLRAEAAKTEEDFNAKFKRNLEKNFGYIQALKDKLFGGESDEEAKAEEGKQSKREFAFSKDPKETGGKGAFEALESLQKRIAGAAFKTPEAQATEEQTEIIKQQGNESRAQWVANMQEQRKLREGVQAVGTILKELDVGTLL